VPELLGNEPIYDSLRRRDEEIETLRAIKASWRPNRAAKK
jgi:hypothetical protein